MWSRTRLIMRNRFLKVLNSPEEEVSFRFRGQLAFVGCVMLESAGRFKKPDVSCVFSKSHQNVAILEPRYKLLLREAAPVQACHARLPSLSTAWS